MRIHLNFNRPRVYEWLGHLTKGRWPSPVTGSMNHQSSSLATPNLNWVTDLRKTNSRFRLEITMMMVYMGRVVDQLMKPSSHLKARLRAVKYTVHLRIQIFTTIFLSRRRWWRMRVKMAIQKYTRLFLTSKLQTYRMMSWKRKTLQKTTGKSYWNTRRNCRLLMRLNTI